MKKIKMVAPVSVGNRVLLVGETYFVDNETYRVNSSTGFSHSYFYGVYDGGGRKLCGVGESKRSSILNNCELLEN